MKSVRAEGAQGVESGQQGGGHGRSPWLNNRSPEADPTRRVARAHPLCALGPSTFTGVLRAGRSGSATDSLAFAFLLGKARKDFLELSRCATEFDAGVAGRGEIGRWVLVSNQEGEGSGRGWGSVATRSWANQVESMYRWRLADVVPPAW